MNILTGGFISNLKTLVSFSLTTKGCGLLHVRDLYRYVHVPIGVSTLCIQIAPHATQTYELIHTLTDCLLHPHTYNMQHTQCGILSVKTLNT